MNSTKTEAVLRGTALDSQNRPSAVRRPTGEPENRSGFQPSQSQPPNNGAGTKSTKAIVAGVPADVKTLRALRSERRIPVADIVGVVASGYPKFDRYLLSKVEHGDEYGIQLRADAIRALLQRYAPEALERPRRPNRKKRNRIQARLPDTLFEQLQRHLQQTGQTAQDFLEGLVSRFFNPSEGTKE